MFCKQQLSLFLWLFVFFGSSSALTRSIYSESLLGFDSYEYEVHKNPFFWYVDVEELNNKCGEKQECLCFYGFDYDANSDAYTKNLAPEEVKAEIARKISKAKGIWKEGRYCAHDFHTRKEYKALDAEDATTSDEEKIEMRKRFGGYQNQEFTHQKICITSVIGKETLGSTPNDFEVEWYSVTANISGNGLTPNTVQTLRVKGQDKIALQFNTKMPVLQVLGDMSFVDKPENVFVLPQIASFRAYDTTSKKGFQIESPFVEFAIMQCDGAKPSGAIWHYSADQLSSPGTFSLVPTVAEAYVGTLHLIMQPMEHGKR